jgi:hypothetical protein
MMKIMLQLSTYTNNSLEAHDVFNFSLTVEQGILKCVANNSFGFGNDSIKLYVTGK